MHPQRNHKKVTLARRCTTVCISGFSTGAGGVHSVNDPAARPANNARDAGGRDISVAASAIEREGRPLVRIAVEDSRPGIVPDVMSRLFVAFVTTKARGKGTGLGLRNCRRIVEEMDGSILASNRAEGGVCFEILLPAAESSDTAV